MLSLLVLIVGTFQIVFSSSNVSNSPSVCPICVSEVQNEFQAFENCTHGSCQRCLLEWIRNTAITAMMSNRAMNLKCPLCRYHLSEKDLLQSVMELIQNKTEIVILVWILEYAENHQYVTLMNLIERHFERHFERLPNTTSTLEEIREETRRLVRSQIVGLLDFYAKECGDYWYRLTYLMPENPTVYQYLRISTPLIEGKLNIRQLKGLSLLRFNKISREPPIIQQESQGKERKCLIA